MSCFRIFLWTLTFIVASSARADNGADGGSAPPISVVATFSILGDMVAQIGGDRVAVATLVGPGADAHAYRPAPADARAVRGAQVLVVNGLGFEGWIDRLIAAAQFEGLRVVASEGARMASTDDDHDGHDDHDHGPVDPHAWQDVSNAIIYAENIAAALSAADAAHGDYYAARAANYTAALHDLQRALHSAASQLPERRRTVVTSHDAFGYFASAYGFEVVAPQGISAHARPSARNMARLIRQIRAHDVPAVFIEGVSDPRLAAQISRETGAVVKGPLYADSLSETDGPAATYIDMMRWNMGVIVDGLAP